MKHTTHNADEMKLLGAEVARSLKVEASEEKLVILVLKGDFGAGKTTFTQGLAAELGITEPVTSPSYVYIQEYNLPGGKAKLVHVDAWRVKRAEDLLLTGLGDYLLPGNVVVVEWGGDLIAEFLGKLPEGNLVTKTIKITERGEDRDVEIS